MKKQILSAGIIALLTSTIALSTACKDDEDDNTTPSSSSTQDTTSNTNVDVNSNTVDQTKQSKFILPITVKSGESTTSLLLAADDLSTGEISVEGNGTIIDGMPTFWVYYGHDYLYGLTYNQGNDGGTQSYYLTSNGEIKARDIKYSTQRFTGWGIYNQDIMTISTGEGPTSKADANGNNPYCFLVSYLNGVAQTSEQNDTEADYDKWTAENYLGNGEYVTINGFIQRNDKLIAAAIPMGLTPYGSSSENGKWVLPGNEDLVATGSTGIGSGRTTPGQLSGTQYPNSCWITIINDPKDFSNKTIIKTDKISYACGRYRSQYHQTIWADDNGNIYVFSPSYAKTQSDSRQKTTLDAGVVRIPANSNDFDDYYFNIEEASNGKGFLRCWHITEDYFLLQMYEEAYTAAKFTGDALSLAIFKASDKSFKYVTGLPEASSITSLCHGLTQPLIIDGKFYVDVSVEEDCAYYGIDYINATATKGLVVKGAASIYASNKLYLQD